MTIEPDTKDWTWVLRRGCPECGFDSLAVAREDVPRLLLRSAASWPAALAAEDVRRRPAPHVWSPLEYGCHVRDVLRLYSWRLQLMLSEDDPLFPNWDQDATAVAERYDEQDPAAVSADLHAAAEALATSFARLSEEQWPRTGRRSDGATFTVESFARYLLHDLVHHEHDVAA
jgi:DinB superfamily